jgi:hypothetical protein
MSVKVAVRVRPFNQREHEMSCLLCVSMKGSTTTLIGKFDILMIFEISAIQLKIATLYSITLSGLMMVFR